MKRLSFLLALVGLVGCYSEDKFEEDMVTTMCDLYAECELFNEYFTEEQCRALGDEETTTGEEVECEYDSAAAKDCIAAWEETTCEDLEALDYPDCNNVYDCADTTDTTDTTDTATE